MYTSTERALDIPELTAIIARFLAKRELQSCVSVCKSWNASFSPRLWRTVAVSGLKKEAAVAHGPDIKGIIFDAPAPPWLVSLNGFSRLRSLTINGRPQDWSVISQLVRGQSATLRRLALFLSHTTVGSEFWDAALACTSLNSLMLEDASLRKEDIPKFWQVFLRLDELYLERVQLPFIEHPDLLPHNPLTRLQSLTMQQVPVCSEWRLQWFQLFPNLKSFKWEGDSEMSSFPIKVLLPAIVKTKTRSATLAAPSNSDGGLWQGLKVLDIVIYDDDDLASALASIDSLHRLRVSVLNQFAQTMSALMRGHKNSLVSLRLDRCKGLTSTMVMDILTECEALEDIAAHTLVAHHVSVGKPWVCHQLQSFTVGVTLWDTGCSNKELTDEEKAVILQDQDDVYTRLAGLSRLTTLNFQSAAVRAHWGITRGPPLDVKHPGFLRMVASLRNLRSISLSGMQRLNLECAEKLVQCAPLTLTHVNGRLYQSEYTWVSIDELLARRKVDSEKLDP